MWIMSIAKRIAPSMCATIAARTSSFGKTKRRPIGTTDPSKTGSKEPSTSRRRLTILLLFYVAFQDLFARLRRKLTGRRIHRMRCMKREFVRCGRRNSDQWIASQLQIASPEASSTVLGRHPGAGV
jgi:hypothetical protein